MTRETEPGCAGGASGTNGRAARCGALDGELRRYQAFSRPFSPHVHDAYVIGAVRAGRRALTCNGEDLALRAGNLLVLNPGDVHGCAQEGAEPLAYDSVALGRGLVEELTGTHGVRLRGPVLRDEGLGRLADGALDALETGDEALAEEALCLLLGALREEAGDGGSRDGGAPAGAEGRPAGGDPQDQPRAAASAGSSPEPSPHAPAGCPDGLDRAAAYLRRHLGDAVRLEDLAARAGMSRYQLVRAWRRRFGLTPMQALASQRVEHARALLAAGATPAEAAQACGFSDQAHLTRAFRDRLGLTPAAYRRAVREEQASAGSSPGPEQPAGSEAAARRQPHASLGSEPACRPPHAPREDAR